MEQTTADRPNVKPPAARRGRPSLARPKLPGDSVFVAQMPTSGADLVAMWELPQAAWREGRLKVTRKQYASGQTELVSESSVEDYDLVGIARDFGPGDYYLLLSAPPSKIWNAHNCKVAISPEYSRAAGFQQFTPAPPPPPAQARLADAAALVSTAHALQTDAPLTVGNLSILIETIVERTMKAQAPAPNPMDMNGMMGFWNAMASMQEKTRKETLDMVAMLQGKEPVPAGEEAGPWAGIGGAIAGALPAILAAFQKAPAPAPAAPAPAGPAYLEEAPAMNVQIPLTSNEAAQFAGAVAMLRPFSGHLVQTIASSPDDQAIAAELADYVPAPLTGQLLRLAELAAARGPAVLGVIAPELATVRGAAVLAALAKILQTD